MKPRLLVIYVVWHPEFARGREIARKIYASFASDPDHPNARGLGIPVFFRSARNEGEATPPPIAMDDAHHSVVVVLVDADMLIENAAWGSYVSALRDQAEAAPDRHRVFPVAFARNYNLIGATNYIRLEDLPADAAPGYLIVRLTNEISRLITARPTLAEAEAGDERAGSPPKMRLFLSHAKLDGEKTALALRDYIRDNLALDTFFDATDIAAGFRFQDEIDGGIDSAAFALVHTDAYASRVWCQYEVIRAKRHCRPVVVIHAIEEGEARSFPYIGNVPTIRWRADQPERIEAVIGLILREVLRCEYFPRHFENLRTLFDIAPEARAISRAPELLTALALRQEADKVPYFVYPDPPLAKQELDLVLELAPNLRLTTPTLLFANLDQPHQTAGAVPKALAGKTVGISISDSENLAVRGMGFPKLPGEATAPQSSHLRDAMTEMARFLLAAGATLAYGGDLRQGGFSLILCELVSAYRAMSGESTSALQSYLAWPIQLDLTKDQQAEWVGLVDIHKIPQPAGLGMDPAVKPPPDTPENLVAWARGLTAMREEMDAATGARIFMGGQIGSFGVSGLGRYPGLAEEALLALRAKKPVYLVGAFGGCTEAIIDAILGKKPAAFTKAVRLAGEDQQAACELYNKSAAEPVDYDALTAEFGRAGVSGLNNGLTEEENGWLFTTTRLPAIIALILRGLSRVGSPMER